jgi:hypothetical protein
MLANGRGARHRLDRFAAFPIAAIAVEIAATRILLERASLFTSPFRTPRSVLARAGSKPFF